MMFTTMALCSLATVEDIGDLDTAKSNLDWKACRHTLPKPGTEVESSCHHKYYVLQYDTPVNLHA